MSIRRLSRFQQRLIQGHRQWTERGQGLGGRGGYYPSGTLSADGFVDGVCLITQGAALMKGERKILHRSSACRYLAMWLKCITSNIPHLRFIVAAMKLSKCKRSSKFSSVQTLSGRLPCSLHRHTLRNLWATNGPIHPSHPNLRGNVPYSMQTAREVENRIMGRSSVQKLSIHVSKIRSHLGQRG